MDEIPQGDATLSSTPLENIQDKAVQVTKRSIIPVWLIIIGILGLLIPSFFLFSDIPDMVTLINQLNRIQFNFIYVIPLFIIIAILLTQIVFGSVLFLEQKKQGGITAKHRSWAKLLLVAGILAGLLIDPAIKITLIFLFYMG